MRGRLCAALVTAGIVFGGSPAQAQDPSGFETQLGAEGVSEPAAPECRLSSGTLRCLITGVDPGSARCNAGGAVTEVELPSEGRARRAVQCVDEGSHEYGVLGPKGTWRRAGFTCARVALGSGIALVSRLVCSSPGGYEFSVDGLGRIRTPSDPRRTWLALGDSYASGEGIPGTDIGRSASGDDCARATGRGTNAQAWAVGAYELMPKRFGFGRQDFVACSGAKTDEIASQIDEAGAAAGSSSWDMVTLGIGGNSIRFSDVLYGCLDVPNHWDEFLVENEGCNESEDRLKARVDMLAGKRDRKRGEYDGNTTLPEVLEKVARVVKPGGDVWVTGYPQLIEEQGRWDAWRRTLLPSCEGILGSDVQTLRGTTGYLNQAIGNAVLDADARFRGNRVRFHFVDIAGNPYEKTKEPDERHALCAGTPWLNGFTTGLRSGDFRLRRSFHPKQEGHSATAVVVAARIENETRFDDVPDTKPLSVSEDQPLQVLTPEGLPPIRLGMTVDEAERAAGVSLERGEFCAAPPGQSDGYYLTTPNERVEVVGVSPNADIATARGVRNGDSLDKVFSVYGDEARRIPGSEETSQGPDAIWTPRGSANGIVFWADTEGEINTMAAGPVKSLEDTVEFCA